jgi:fructosamine-3-kinase
LRGNGDYAALGARLLSSINPRRTFRLATDNYIGRTPQLNRFSLSWLTFWRGAPDLSSTWRRKRPEKVSSKKGDQLGEALFSLSNAPRCIASHGDHGGKCGLLVDGAPVLFDPAVYWGRP